MKHIQDFESFLNEATLNEAALPQTIEELEKLLPKVVDAYEFLTVWYNYGSAFSMSLATVLTYLSPKMDLSKACLTQGQYVTYQRKRAEDGYGDSNVKLVQLKAEYDEMVRYNEFNKLFSITKDVMGQDKFYKKLATELAKSMDKLELAQRILTYAWDSASDSYDRNLTMDKYYRKLGGQLWYNSSEVYNSVGSGFTTAGNSPFKQYLIDLRKRFKKDFDWVSN
jgi:hypothetical protein